MKLDKIKKLTDYFKRLIPFTMIMMPKIKTPIPIIIKNIENPSSSPANMGVTETTITSIPIIVKINPTPNKAEP